MTINTLNNHTSTTESIVMPVVRPGVNHEGARGLGRVLHSNHDMKRKLQRARNVVVDEMRRGEECFTWTQTSRKFRRISPRLPKTGC